MQSLRPLLLLAAALVLLLGGRPAAASSVALDGYAVTVVNATVLRAAALPRDHWALFDTSYGNKSAISADDDPKQFDPLDFCMPFFQLSSARMYISSNGFLSPVPYAPCTYFCSNTRAGDYHFSTDGDGGDWPMIGLYVDDLNPPASASDGGVFKRVGYKTVLGSNISMALVSFVAVPPYTNRAARPMTAQVELWANGTIVMRYQQLGSTGSGLVSIGLIWTKLQRTTPTLWNEAMPVAVRYDPKPSPCALLTSCTACARSSACSWCPGQCVPARSATDFCPRTDLNLCNSTRRSSQTFYNTSSWLQTPATPSLGGVWTSVTTAPGVRANLTFPLTAALNFSFPVFYNPPVWVQNNVSFTSSVFVDERQYLGLLRDQPLCGLCPSAECWRICAKAVLPFVSRNEYDNATTTTLVATFPPRGPSPWFCTEPSCPATLVVETTGLQNYVKTGGFYSFQTILFANGSVQLRYNTSFDRRLFPALANMTAQCSSESVYVQYPAPTIGIVHASPQDATSPLFSWAALRDGTVLAFDPVRGCVDCNGRGRCNLTTRQCDCDAAFTGENCTACRAGYYGSDCTPCPTCFNGATCDDGSSGSGICICKPNLPFSGEFCNVTCPGPAPSSCTPACNRFGGFCVCGVCTCHATMGYYGPRCANWSDPCAPFSLDQCPVCTASNPQCRYCGATYQCVTNPALVIVADNLNRSNASCTPGFLYTKSQGACVTYAQPPNPDQGVAVVIVIIIFGGIAFLSCFVIVVVCVCRKPIVNSLTTGAVMGTPDFQFPRREREVVQMVLMKPPGKDGPPVQGIPLKQMPLKELYELQYGKGGAGGDGKGGLGHSAAMRQRTASQIQRAEVL
jgi:hypothetical protein